MVLPTLEKTWEFSLNNYCDSTVVGSKGGNDEGSAQAMILAFVNYFTDKYRKGWGGTFSDQGGGTVRFTPDAVPAANPYDANHTFVTCVGKTIKFVGCNSAGNDGSFTITAVSGADWCEFVNSGSPVFEADANCDFHVLAGNFTNPLTVKGSSASLAARSYGMDGKDRWRWINDYRSYTSGNRDWIVLQTTGGCEILFWHDTSSTSYEYERMVMQVSPEVGFTGGTYTAAPTASDSREYISRTLYWPPGSSCYSLGTFYLNVMMSDDGECFRAWVQWDNITNWILMMQPADDCVTDGALIPWSGNQNVCGFYRHDTVATNVVTIDTWRDSARWVVTLDKDATVGGPFKASLYLTSEMVTDSALLELSESRPDELTWEYSFHPIGLASTTTNYRGWYGRLADIWFIGSYGPPYGTTFPEDNSKQFIRMGDFIFPWDGATTYRIRVP